MDKSLLVVLLSATLLLSACNENGSPAAEVSDEFVAAAQDAVAGALLTLDDLPAGWTSEPQDEDDDIEPEFSGECEMANQDEFPGEVASADSDKLMGPDDQIVYASAMAFPSEDIAQDALDTYWTLVKRCRGQLQDELISSYRESFAEEGVSDGDIATLNVSVEDLVFPPIKESLNAYRVDWGMRLGGVPIGGTMDFVFWGEGKMLGGMVYLAFGGGPDIADQEKITRIIAERLRLANRSLPEYSVFRD